MRARVDSGQIKNAWTIIDRAYSDEFLSKLKEEFGFDALKPDWAHEIRRIGRNYIVDCRLDDDGQQLRRSRKSYKAFLSETEIFLKSLVESYEHEDFYNIAMEMLMVARETGVRQPQKVFPNLTEHQQNTEAHYRELVRLTKLIRSTLKRGIKSSESRPGPRQNLALKHLVISSAEFWTSDLGRKFTVDYHEKSGLTRSFLFVQALVKPLDIVRDNAIVTAMRADISVRARRKKRRSS